MAKVCPRICLLWVTAVVISGGWGVPAVQAAPSARQLYEEGLGYMENEAWATAVKRFERAIAIKPRESRWRDYYPYLYQGIALYKLRRYEESLAALRESVRQGKSADASEYLEIVEKNLAQKKASGSPPQRDSGLVFNCDVSQGFADCRLAPPDVGAGPEAALTAEKEKIAMEKKRLVALEARLARQRAKLQAHASAKASVALKAERAKLARERRELAALAATLQAQRDSLARQKQALSTASSRKAAETSRYDKEKAALDQREQALAEKAEALARERERLSRQMLSKQKLDAELQALAARAAALEKERQVLEGERRKLLALKDETRKASATLAAKRANLARLEAEIAKRQAALAELQRQNSSNQKAFLAEVAAQRKRAEARRRRLLAAVKDQRRVALVIGNADYRAAPLANPVNDARDVARALKRVGFQVRLETNVGKRAMDEAIRRYGRALAEKKNTVGLFYYAGHGVQVEGENYLVPIGGGIRNEVDLKYKSVPLGYVLDNVHLAKNDMNLVILDACRDNPYRSLWRSSSRGLARVDGPRGSIIAYATAPGSVSLDGKGKNGVYTKYLLREMQRPNVPIELLFKRVRNAVETATKGRQVPWESSSLKGDFYFLVQ